MSSARKCAGGSNSTKSRTCQLAATAEKDGNLNHESLDCDRICRGARFAKKKKKKRTSGESQQETVVVLPRCDDASHSVSSLLITALEQPLHRLFGCPYDPKSRRTSQGHQAHRLPRAYYFPSRSVWSRGAAELRSTSQTKINFDDAGLR